MADMNPTRTASAAVTTGGPPPVVPEAPRIVVFGGTGFVGRNVVAALGQVGYVDVLAVGSEVDIRDYQRVESVLREGDAVVNAAGIASATERRAIQARAMEGVNVDGAENVARAASSVRASRLVHISSVAAQGPIHGRGLTEADMRPPQSPYARSKLQAERVVARAAGDTPLSILRPTSIFGPGRGLTNLMVRLARLPLLPLPRSGRVLVPLCHVANVAHAVMLAMSTSSPNSEPITIADRSSTLLSDALTTVASAAFHKRPRLVPLPTSVLRVGAAMVNGAARIASKPSLFDEARLRMLTRDIEFDVSRAERVLGYQPVVGTIEGLRDVAMAHGRAG